MPLEALQLEYNGYTFSPYCSSKVNVTPVYDEAGRTVVYSVAKLHAREMVDDESGTDSKVEDLLARLTAPAGELKYSNGRGFGSFEINSGEKKDVIWGPKPKLLSYTPSGGKLACIIEWECEVAIPFCTGAKYTAPSILAANYEITFAINDEGLTTQTVHGYIQIPQTRSSQDNRKITATVDDVRNQIEVTVPLGFQRTSQVYQISKDKCRLDFTCVDTQRNYPLPDGAIRCDVRHRVSSQALKKGAALVNWNNTISGTITVAPGELKASAWDKFKLILDGRIRGARINGGTVTNPRGVYIHSLDFEEDIFSNTSTFSVSYWIMGASITDILQSSGLWQGIGRTSFQSWRQSLEANVSGPRGSADLKLLANSDLIVDLCEGGQAKIPVSTATTDDKPSKATGGPTVSLESASATWIYYQCNLSFDEDDRVIRHKPLTGASKTTTVPPTVNATGSVQAAAGSTGANAPTVKSGVKDITQRVSSPSYNVTLYGEALRIGFEIPAPELTNVGGVKLTQLYANIDQGVVARLGLIPIYKATWVIGYLCDDDPTKIPVPVNPMLQTAAKT